MRNGNVQDTSMSSSMEMNGVQSSCSDQSMNRDQTHSQSQYRCYVGIQINDNDISSVVDHHSRSDCDKDYLVPTRR